MRNGTTAPQIKENTKFLVSRIETIAKGEIDYGRVGYLVSHAQGYLLQRDDILFSHINSIEHVGKVAIYNQEYSLYHGMNLLLIRFNDKVSPRYGYYILCSEQARRYIQREAKKAINQVSLGQAEIGNLSFFLPQRNEQNEIIKVLDTLETTIRKTEAIIEKLKQIKQGLLHDLLARGIDANGELRPPPELAPQLYKESTLGLIPRAWQIAPLLAQVSLPQGQVSPLRKPYCDWVLIAPDHIESGTGVILAKQTALDQNAISGKYIFQAGDVLYSKIRPYLCKAALADSDGLCSADMYPLRPSQGMDPRFLLALVLSEIFTSFATSVSMRTGIPKINREELAGFMFAWPSAEEQVKIADILATQDRKITSTSSDLEKLKNLKTALMNDLLTGQVRVTPLLDENPPAP